MKNKNYLYCGDILDYNKTLFFGRTGEEILKALEFYDAATERIKNATKENSQMTREEARRIAHGYGYRMLPDTLEALGLLKFEQEEKKQTADSVVYECLGKISKAYGNIPFCSAPEIVEALRQAGYLKEQK